MYRYGNGQISLSDFQQPMGMCLREDNRWVKKAQLLPWEKIEAKYASFFPSATGNVAKPLQLALGACLIQREYGYSDEEIVLQIQENPYLQYFCGYAGYDGSKPPFDPSSMVHFRKRLTPEILVEINEMVIQAAEKKDDQNNNAGGSGNSGTIAAVPTAKMTRKAISTKEVRGTLPQSCSGRQNLPKPRESPLLQRAGDPAVRPCSGKTQERRGTEQGPGLPGRMRAGRSRTQIQPGKAEMWNGSGDGEAGRYSCACGCSVHSAAESAKDSEHFLQFLNWLLGYLQPCEKLRVVQ